MTGSSFIDRLQAGRMPTREEMRFPCFPVREIGDRIAAAEKPKLLKPSYSYDIDWAAIEAERPEALRRLDDMGKERVRQLMAQLIPGVEYETGTTTENHSTFIWARPVRVRPEYAPHVMAWGQVIAGLCP